MGNFGPLIDCPNCGQLISSNLKTCPLCRHSKEDELVKEKKPATQTKQQKFDFGPILQVIRDAINKIPILYVIGFTIIAPIYLMISTFNEGASTLNPASTMDENGLGWWIMGGLFLVLWSTIKSAFAKKFCPLCQTIAIPKDYDSGWYPPHKLLITTKGCPECGNKHLVKLSSPVFKRHMEGMQK